MSSFYNKKKTKKWTWLSSDGENKNEIDYYICSSSTKIIQDTATLNSFNINSDHRMSKGKNERKK